MIVKTVEEKLLDISIEYGKYRETSEKQIKTLQKEYGKKLLLEGNRNIAVEALEEIIHEPGCDITDARNIANKALKIIKGVKDGK